MLMEDCACILMTPANGTVLNASQCQHLLVLVLLSVIFPVVVHGVFSHLLLCFYASLSHFYSFFMIWFYLSYSRKLKT